MKNRLGLNIYLMILVCMLGWSAIGLIQILSARGETKPSTVTDHLLAVDCAITADLPVPADKANPFLLKYQRKIIGSCVILRNEAKKTMVILTAGHVITAMRKDGKFRPLFVKEANGREKLLMTLKLNIEADLALLETYRNVIKPGPQAILAKAEPTLGSTIWLLGHHFRYNKYIAKSTLSAYEPSATNPRAKYVLETVSCRGISGGGIFNEQGKLIGIAQGFITPHYPMPYGDTLGLTYGAGLSSLTDFLKDFYRKSKAR